MRVREGDAMLKLNKATASIAIVLSAIVAALSVIGIVFLCIFMPTDVEWKPFGSTSAGVYNTRDDCSAVFGASNITVEIYEIDTETADGDTALAAISDKLAISVSADGAKTDIRVLGVSADYYTDHGMFTFVLYNGDSAKTINCETVEIDGGKFRTALAFFTENVNEPHDAIVFTRGEL